MPIGSELVEGGNFGDQSQTALGPMVRNNLGFDNPAVTVNADQTYGRYSGYSSNPADQTYGRYSNAPPPTVGAVDTPQGEGYFDNPWWKEGGYRVIEGDDAPTSVMAPNTPVESSAPPNGFFGGDNVESITGDEGGLLSDSAPPAEEGTTGNAGYGWGFAGNTAGNMIDTRDKELVGGTQGSQSGYLKGALKGAGTGASIGTMIAPGVGTAWGGAIGGAVGLLGASQGYFDSRTPPQTTTQTVQAQRGSGFGGQSISLFG
jgi:hypothetical protein